LGELRMLGGSCTKLRSHKRNLPDGWSKHSQMSDVKQSKLHSAGHLKTVQETAG